LAIAFCSAMRSYSGSEASRTWRRKLIPAVKHLMLRSPSEVLHLLEKQTAFHPRLRGVPHHATILDSTASRKVSLRVCAQRAAELFISVTTARQVDIDVDLYDSLAAPLTYVVQNWMSQIAGVSSQSTEGNGESSTCDTDVESVDRSSRTLAGEGPLFPLETLVDILDACVQSGVDGGQVSLVITQLVADELPHSGESMAILDLARVAHAISYLGVDAEELIDSIWDLAQPKLVKAEPYVALMLLDAVVRGSSDMVLHSEELNKVVDQHLVQKLDIDAGMLGRMGG